jgi:hypothetical protein
MLVDIQIAFAFKLQIESPVTGEELQHVVEEADAGMDFIAALPFNGEREAILVSLVSRRISASRFAGETLFRWSSFFPSFASRPLGHSLPSNQSSFNAPMNALDTAPSAPRPHGDAHAAVAARIAGAVAHQYSAMRFIAAQKAAVFGPMSASTKLASLGQYRIFSASNAETSSARAASTSPTYQSEISVSRNAAGRQARASELTL